MGKDFVSLKMNHLDIREAYYKLNRVNNVKSASDEKWFKRTPTFSEIDDIDVGVDDTKESIIRLKDGGFIEINKTIPINKLKEVV